ncbi:hypothetical protein [Amycolatopsis minnesotensis]|uniref:Uncharacterized protein n=1 Tax=Amycolatopsis minnesotensis TaxID=337894 RepID=A0ABN2QT30_9PSEU
MTAAPHQDALDQVRAIADAVLYEGYLLYPYRASARKNQVRWQFGVLVPPAFAGRATGEQDCAHSEFLLEPGHRATLHARVRFLQVQARVVEVADTQGVYQEVPSATVDGIYLSTWDEAVEREIDADLPVTGLLAGEAAVPFSVPGAVSTEEHPRHRDEPGVRTVRRTWPLRGVLRMRADALDGPYGGLRLTLRVENTTDWAAGDHGRAEALRHAFVATHTLCHLSEGRFLSMTDPPEWAAAAAKACRNDRGWPVLVGSPDRADTVLVTPIILGDYPVIAPESAGELFDGTEIDEILTLRTMAMTDEEKRQARATDPRASELIDRVDHLPPELLERLHGTVRYLRGVTAKEPPTCTEPKPEAPWWDPGADASVDPGTDHVTVGGIEVAAGAKVVLRPGRRRSDAQDMFLDGKTATVRAVLSDVDGETHVAVTVDDDPGADLQDAQGRFAYFSPDEVEPVPGDRT